MAEDLRTRVLDATFAEVGENGLRGLTVEAVAARAGSSRATIYRHFPGGREELIETTVRREVTRFFESLLADLPGPDDVVAHVEAIVIGAHRRLGEHRILQRLLVDEAEAIVPSLATVQPLVQAALTAHLETVLAATTRREGVEAGPAADYCARMVLSFVGSGGAWDLRDPDDVHALVAGHVLAGVLP